MNSRAHSRAEVEEVAVSAIVIGERRRKKMGSLTALARSIEEKGLLHPIVVDGENRLVAGGRRLAAVQRIGWHNIPVRRFANLTDDELREIELEENAQRLDLDSYEASRERLREIKAAQSQAEEETRANVAQVSKPARGPSPKPGSVREVAKRTGMSEGDIKRTRKHVSIADEFPALQSPDWKKSHVLQADEHLREIGEEHREVFGEMLSEPGIDRQTGLKMLENVAGKPKAERKRIAKLYQSNDPGKQGLAKTAAANVPPSPPRHLTRITSIRDDLAREIRDAPKKHQPELRHVADLLGRIVAQMDSEYQAFKEKEMAR